MLQTAFFKEKSANFKGKQKRRPVPVSVRIGCAFYFPSVLSTAPSVRLNAILQVADFWIKLIHSPECGF